MTISVVIPTLDEAATLPRLLAALGEADEVVVADGGSHDGTRTLVGDARLVDAPRGRGAQLAAGAAAATGDIVWFLHADAHVPAGAFAALRAARRDWGCFAVTLDSHDPRLRATAALMTARARRSGSCTGDMGIWLRRPLYEALGGFPNLAAFEDLVFTDRARAAAPWQVLSPPLVVSPRRWDQRGVSRTIAELLALRLAYRAGVPAHRLEQLYRR